jgi:hypothetical protein
MVLSAETSSFSNHQTTIIINTLVSECLIAEWGFGNLDWPSAEQLSQKKWSSLSASSTVMSIQAGWNLKHKNYAEDYIHSKPDIHIIKTSDTKQTIFHVNPLWTCPETSNLLHLSWLSRQTNSLKNDLLKTIY